MREKQYYVYMMTNKMNTTLYTGMSGLLSQRIYQHKTSAVPGFTRRYHLHKLVYYEIFSSPYEAISREKQIKGGSRLKKIELIESANKEWKDLSEELF